MKNVNDENLDNNIIYHIVPYTFKNSSETIRAAIRLYNNMDIDDNTLAYLLNVFTSINECNPPKLGSTVQIPVLTQYINLHK